MSNESAECLENSRASLDWTADSGCPFVQVPFPHGCPTNVIRGCRSLLGYCVFRVSLEGDVDVGAWLQGYSVAGWGGQGILDANLAEEIVGRGDGYFRFFGLAGDAGLNHLVDHGRYSRPGAISVPEKLGLIRESTFMFASEEVA